MTDPADFVQKRKALFESLACAEKDLVGSSLHQQAAVTLRDLESPEVGGPPKRKKTDLLPRNNRKESIFKKPSLPIDKCLKPRLRPDYQVNPDKWKKYSLEDVETSDRSNSAAAFAFLREIEKRKEAAELEATPAGGSQKIVFKKSTKLRPVEEAEEEDKPTTRGSKVVMPEYVVGQKRQRKSDKPRRLGDSSKDKRSQQLKLDHLNEEEDE